MQISCSPDLEGCFSLDCETTGLRPFHGDEPFLIASAKDISKKLTSGAFWISGEKTEYAGGIRLVAGDRYVKRILNNATNTIFFHNAKFDLHHLYALYGPFPINATIWDTMVVARILNNQHLSYSLDACVKRDLGLEKSTEVDDYIEEHKLWEWENLPGKQARVKKKFFHHVPWEILERYAKLDAELTYKLGMWQIEQIKKDPSLEAVVLNELKLTKTVFEMEQTGVNINPDFCASAIEFEEGYKKGSETLFKQYTARNFIDSGKLFSVVFSDQKHLWKYTEKGNPSFETDVLKTFEGEAAKAVVQYRNSKARANFLNGFLYHKDSKGVIHPSFNQAGTLSGRFSSSNPNFQNLSDEDEDEGLYKIRQAIIPHNPGDYLVSFDYDQVEYRLMIEYAREMELANKIIHEKLDVHNATAQMMGVSRQEAKTINFMLLYGGGSQKLADSLKITLEEARLLKARYFKTLPNIKAFISEVISVAEQRGYVFNWLGRKLYFPNPEFAYKAPNALIQGGCADIIKVAMNEIQELLKPYQTKMIMTVHDELIFNMPAHEVFLCVQIKEIMERAFPSKILPLTVGCAYSRNSLAALKPGFPGEDAKAGDQV